MVSDRDIVKDAKRWFGTSNSKPSGNLINEQMLNYPSQIDSTSIKKDDSTGIKINLMKFFEFSGEENQSPSIDEIASGTMQNPSENSPIKLVGDKNEAFKMHESEFMNSNSPGFDNNNLLSIRKMYPTDYGFIRTGNGNIGDIVCRSVISSEGTYFKSKLGDKNKAFIIGFQNSEGLEYLGENMIAFLNSLMNPVSSEEVYLFQTTSSLLLDMRLGNDGPTVEEVCNGKFQKLQEDVYIGDIHIGSNGDLISINDGESLNCIIKFIKINSPQLATNFGYPLYKLQYTKDNGRNWHNFDTSINSNNYWYSYTQFLNSQNLDNRNFPLPVRRGNSEYTLNWKSLQIPSSSYDFTIKSIIIKFNDTSEQELTSWQTVIENNSVKLKFIVDSGAAGKQITDVVFKFSESDLISVSVSDQDIQVPLMESEMFLNFDTIFQ